MGPFLTPAHEFCAKKATTAKSKETKADFAEKKLSFLADVAATVTMEEVPPELILNWDQTGIIIVPCSTWTMNQRGAKRVKMIGTSNKRQITAVFCDTLTGDFMPMQVYLQGQDLTLPHSFHLPIGMAYHPLT